MFNKIKDDIDCLQKEYGDLSELVSSILKVCNKKWGKCRGYVFEFTGGTGCK